MRAIAALLAVSAAAGLALASSAADRGQPPLFFREDFTETPPSLPLTNEDLANPDLVVTRHGPGESVIKKSFHDFKPGDPYYVWSGLCPGTWAVSLRKRGAAVDLRAGKVRWRAKQSGFRELRIVIRTADGKWYAGDQSDAASEDWRVREFAVADLRWRTLDIAAVVEAGWAAPAPDLSRVVEIGFTDLMAGGRSAACSRLDWIEVFGEAVAAPPSD